MRIFMLIIVSLAMLASSNVSLIAAQACTKFEDCKGLCCWGNGQCGACKETPAMPS